MAKAKFTQYYKNAIEKLVDYLDEEQHLAIRIDQIKGETATITIGVSDGKGLILEFGTVAMREGYITHVDSDNIYIDMHKMIHMEYNSNVENNSAFPMLEAWNS
jgi:hypothetical protein